ncbi:MAG TPA: hypothetical protein VLY04_15195 [Bryobacteraceae bacterium]|nr:hypothetical protein [Bryobacteraceae bacterium]
MGSVSNLPSGIAFLTQPGTGLLADLPVQLSSSALQSASQQDLVELASSALQMQQVDGIFGITSASQGSSALPAYTPALQAGATTPAASLTEPSGASLELPTGVSGAELANATPVQQAAVADQTAQQQLVQALFYPTSSLPGTTNIVG